VRLNIVKVPSLESCRYSTKAMEVCDEESEGRRGLVLVTSPSNAEMLSLIRHHVRPCLEAAL
jgi:hypothetical protein